MYRIMLAVTLGLISSQVQADEVIQFLGQSTPASFDDILQSVGEDPSDWACFEMDMVDPNTGDLIGRGADCLMFLPVPGRVVNIKGLQRGRAFQNLAGDIAVEAISLFMFDDGDLLVTRGRTSVRPLLDGFGDGGEPQRTHATGSIPDPDAESVLLATGTRQGRQGPVRVSGALAINENGIYFDCVWIHQLDLPTGFIPEPRPPTVTSRYVSLRQNSVDDRRVVLDVVVTEVDELVTGVALKLNYPDEFSQFIGCTDGDLFPPGPCFASEPTSRPGEVFIGRIITGPGDATTVVGDQVVVRLEFLVFGAGEGMIIIEGQNLSGGDASAVLDINGDPIFMQWFAGTLRGE